MKLTWIKRFLVINLLGFVLLSTSCSKILNLSKRSYVEYSEKGPYEAIIVPGVPFEGEKWSNTMKLRVYWSYYLWSNGYAKNIIYSGSAVYSPYIEAEIMAQYGKALGIPEENIYMEKYAEHSTENLYYGEKLARELGFESVALATDPFQNSMLGSFRKKHYQNVAVLPVQFNIIDGMDMPDPEIEHEDLIVQNFTALPDREGFFKRLAGTMGKNVVDSIQN